MITVSIMGRISSEVKSVQVNDKDIAEFDVVTNRRYPNKEGEWLEEEVYIRVTCWGGLARSARAMAYKGREIAISSTHIDVDAWISKSGNERAKLHVTAEHVEYFGKGPAARAKEEEENGKAEPIRGEVVKATSGHKIVRKVARVSVA